MGMCVKRERSCQIPAQPFARHAMLARTSLRMRQNRALIVFLEGFNLLRRKPAAITAKLAST